MEKVTKPNVIIHEKTGIELICIPAGLFLYEPRYEDRGDDYVFDRERENQTWKSRLRKIDLPQYCIGRYPVTNAQFARFVQATNYKTTAEVNGFGMVKTIPQSNQSEWVKGADWRHPSGPQSGIGGKGDHPVVQVSFVDAQDFCHWARLYLPSNQEWEKAARGTDDRTWPWGEDAPTDQHCNLGSNIGGTTLVGQYSPKGDSPYGCVDMIGNVLEWVNKGDYSHWYQEMRGGSWALMDYMNPRLFQSLSTRKDFTASDYGFRVRL